MASWWANGLAAVFAALLVAQHASKPPTPRLPPARDAGFTVVKSYPHDRDAYTQGLEFVDGTLYESTGQYGGSSLRRVNLENGQVTQRHALPNQIFGEGLTVWKNTIVQITWQSNLGFVYDRASFKELRTFTYPGEGWGLTNDGARLIMSDGSDTLRFWDPASLKELGRIAVRDRGAPVTQLNELEFVGSEILANVYMTDRIVRVSPADGRVLGWIDLTGLLAPQDAVGAEVLNGIAYDAASDRLFVTGKQWPKLFEIKLVPK